DGQTPADTSAVEAEVLRALPIDRTDRERLDELAGRVEEAFAGRAERLEDDGYVMSAGRLARARVAAAAPAGAGLARGAHPAPDPRPRGRQASSVPRADDHDRNRDGGFAVRDRPQSPDPPRQARPPADARDQRLAPTASRLGRGRRRGAGGRPLR